MNTKAAASETLMDNVIYLILLIVFFSLMTVYVHAQSNSASTWADYYAKEIVRTINLAQPGDVITLDIHRATEIARNNEVALSEIVMISNTNDEVCIKLSRGRKTCYHYFNGFDITNPEVKLGVSGNVVQFQIIEAQK